MRVTAPGSPSTAPPWAGRTPKGLVFNPVGKPESVTFTPQGLQPAERRLQASVQAGGPRGRGQSPFDACRPPVRGVRLEAERLQVDQRR